MCQKLFQQLQIFITRVPVSILGQEIKYFPVGSIMSPVGTVIHGPNSLDIGKRLKLKNSLYRT